MKLALAILPLCFIIAGCANHTAQRNAPAPQAVTVTAAGNSPVAPGFSQRYHLSWASAAPNISFYQVQQTTNIFSTNWFGLTNVIGTNCIVMATNQSGTWRVRAIGNDGLPSAWAYLTR